MMLDIGFSVETTKEFEDLNKKEILTALQDRINALEKHWEPGAIGYCDEFEL